MTPSPTERQDNRAPGQETVNTSATQTPRAHREVMTLLDFLPSLQHAATTRIDPTVWPLTARVDDLGRLTVGDVALTDLADQYGTPAYVVDEKDFRRRIRDYRALCPTPRSSTPGSHC